MEKGGPDVLEEACNQDRSLFLCYPDDFEGGTDSLGLQCIQSFDGDVVSFAVRIHPWFCLPGVFPLDFIEPVAVRFRSALSVGSRSNS